MCVRVCVSVCLCVCVCVRFRERDDDLTVGRFSYLSPENMTVGLEQTK